MQRCGHIEKSETSAGKIVKPGLEHGLKSSHIIARRTKEMNDKIRFVESDHSDYWEVFDRT